MKERPPAEQCRQQQEKPHEHERKQPEATAQRKQTEDALYQLVLESLDRTQGKQDEEAYEVVNSFCREHILDPEMAKTIIASARAEWSKPKPGQLWTNSLGIKFTWVPPGKFWMGGIGGESLSAWVAVVGLTTRCCAVQLPAANGLPRIDATTSGFALSECRRSSKMRAKAWALASISPNTLNFRANTMDKTTNPSELLPAPTLPARTQDKWRREQQAFRRLLASLLATHKGEYVAVHEEQVVESGPDKLEVAHKAYARFGYVPIFVSLVTDQPLPPVRLPSPRLPKVEERK